MISINEPRKVRNKSIFVNIIFELNERLQDKALSLAIKV